MARRNERFVAVVDKNTKQKARATRSAAFTSSSSFPVDSVRSPRERDMTKREKALKRR